MTYQTQASGSQPNVPRGGTVFKAQNAIYERITTGEGATVDTWRVQDRLIRGVNNRAWVDASNATPNIDRGDYATSDFAGFDWISTSNFVGEKTVEGRKCLVFKDRIITQDPGEINIMKTMAKRMRDDWNAAKIIAGQNGQRFTEPEPAAFNVDQYKGEVTAYIDEETRLPVALVYPIGKQNVARYYQFQVGPQTLAIPPDVQKLLPSSTSGTAGTASK